MTVVGATLAASQALLVGPLVKRFGAAGAFAIGIRLFTLQRVIWSHTTRIQGVMLLGLALGSPGFGADSIIQQLALEYHPSSTPPRGELAASFLLWDAGCATASWSLWGGLFAWGRRSAGPARPLRSGRRRLCVLFLRFPWRRAKAKGEVLCPLSPRRRELGAGVPTGVLHVRPDLLAVLAIESEYVIACEARHLPRHAIDATPSPRHGAQATPCAAPVAR